MICCFLEDKAGAVIKAIAQILAFLRGGDCCVRVAICFIDTHAPARISIVRGVPGDILALTRGAGGTILYGPIHDHKVLDAFFFFTVLGKRTASTVVWSQKLADPRSRQARELRLCPSPAGGGAGAPPRVAPHRGAPLVRQRQPRARGGCYRC